MARKSVQTVIHTKFQNTGEPIFQVEKLSVRVCVFADIYKYNSQGTKARGKNVRNVRLCLTRSPIKRGGYERGRFLTSELSSGLVTRELIECVPTGTHQVSGDPPLANSVSSQARPDTNESLSARVIANYYSKNRRTTHTHEPAHKHTQERKRKTRHTHTHTR